MPCLKITRLAGIGKVRTFSEFKSACYGNTMMSALSCSTCSNVFYDEHNRQRHDSLIHRVGGNIVVISVKEILIFPLIWSIIWMLRIEQPQKQRPIVENVVRLFKMMRH